MLDARVQALGRGVSRYTLTRRGAALSRREVLEGWRGGEEAPRRFFVELLADAGFDCFRFETPALTAATAGRPFELVLVDSPEIDLAPDPRDFQERFEADPADVLVFDNLGGDAAMIVPRPRAGAPGYAHIAGFLRHAPLEQQLALWRTVGEAALARLGDRPAWLNTAGGGVPWLHVRLDSRPKYYVFDAYRRPPDA